MRPKTEAAWTACTSKRIHVRSAPMFVQGRPSGGAPRLCGLRREGKCDMIPVVPARAVPRGRSTRSGEGRGALQPLPRSFYDRDTLRWPGPVGTIPGPGDRPGEAGCAASQRRRRTSAGWTRRATPISTSGPPGQRLCLPAPGPPISI